MLTTIKTKTCTKCLVEKPVTDFPIYYGEKRKEGITRNVCKKCKNKKQLECINSSPDRKTKVKQYFSEYYKKHNDVGKVKSYRTVDKKKDRESITLKEFRDLLSDTPSCFYCEEDRISMLGLDRKDNTKGHALSNVVVCCEKCNHLLADIPFEAKLLLKEGLKQIREKGLFDNWEIKTKRKKDD